MGTKMLFSESMVEAFRERKVTFSFTKANGETVIRTGTRNPDFFPPADPNVPPKVKTEETEETEAQKKVFRYFDLSKNAWRSCIKENVLWWNTNQ